MYKLFLHIFCEFYSITVSGSATETTDYTISTKVFLYQPSDPSTKEVTISTVDDQRLEGLETITLTLSSTNLHVTPVNIPSTTITIVDNDGLYLCVIYTYC